MYAEKRAVIGEGGMECTMADEEMEVQREISRELSRLDENSQMLLGLVERLVKRLGPVLAPRPEKGAGQDAEPGAATDVGRYIRQIRSNIEVANAQLRSTINSAEI